MNGKTAFILGGSKGIGKEIVLSFARAGVSQLAVGARSNLSALKQDVETVAKESGKQSPKFLPVAVDITSRPSIEDAAKAIEKEFGCLDILVIVAAAIGPRGKLVETDPDEWWSLFELNLRGPYLAYRSFIPLLLKSDGGLKTICSVSSVGAWCTSATLSAYQTSKTALVRIADFIAEEYGEEGLISFSIHPGNIPTEILGPDGPPEILKHVFVDTTRLPADTVVYLTKERRDWLNGRYINCTWDMPQLDAKQEYIKKEDKLKVTLSY